MCSGQVSTISTYPVGNNSWKEGLTWPSHTATNRPAPKTVRPLGVHIAQLLERLAPIEMYSDVAFIVVGSASSCAVTGL